MVKPTLAKGYESLSEYFLDGLYHPCIFEIHCGESKDNNRIFDPRATTVEILGAPAVFDESMLSWTIRKSLFDINIDNAAFIIGLYSGKQPPEIGKPLTYKSLFLELVSELESTSKDRTSFPTLITKITETYIGGSGGRKMKKLYTSVIDEKAREEYKKRIM